MYPYDEVDKVLRNRHSNRGDKIKIVVSGIHYPMSIMRYFISALQARDDVDLWTCGPFTGNYIPWGGGMQIFSKHIHTPNLPFSVQTIDQKLSSVILKNQLPWKPDIFMVIDAGWHFKDRPYAENVILIETDPHVLKNRYNEIADVVDKVYCMQKVYSRPTDRYLPYCACSEFHYPEEYEKEYDVCLIGLQYEHRTKLLNRLDGLKVFYSIGQVFDEYREIYNKSRIAFSWSSKLDLIAREIGRASCRERV